MPNPVLPSSHDEPIVGDNAPFKVRLWSHELTQDGKIWRRDFTMFDQLVLMYSDNHDQGSGTETHRLSDNGAITFTLKDKNADFQQTVVFKPLTGTLEMIPEQHFDLDVTRKWLKPTNGNFRIAQITGFDRDNNPIQIDLTKGSDDFAHHKVGFVLTAVREAPHD